MNYPCENHTIQEIERMKEKENEQELMLRYWLTMLALAQHKLEMARC
jgi:hypothetical protein